MKVFGAVPPMGRNLFKFFRPYIIFYFILLVYARLSIIRCGEEYKLFWPEQPEFVRMAARFGATVVPFGTVGENDITELVFDYNDLMKIPLINNYIRESRRTIRASAFYSSGFAKDPWPLVLSVWETHKDKWEI